MENENDMPGEIPGNINDQGNYVLNGKLRPFYPEYQRQINAVHVLKMEHIISEKEFYILRHRIYKAIEEKEKLRNPSM